MFNHARFQQQFLAAFGMLVMLAACGPAASGGSAPIPASTLLALTTLTPVPPSGASGAPGSPTPHPTRSMPEMVSTTHTVRPGDTLTGIATAFGTSVDALMAANGLTDPNQLVIGQTLAIPVVTAVTGPDSILIPDSEAVYSPAFTEFDVTAAVARHPGWLNTYSETVDDHAMTGAELVQMTALQYSVGPRVLLTLLELRSQALSAPELAPEMETYPLGYVRDNWDGLAAQLMWAAGSLNTGFYGWWNETLWTLDLADGTRIQFSPAINAGTAALQHLFAEGSTYESWKSELQTFSETYQKLWGDPFNYTVDPLLPSDLTAPTLTLPWPTGETWYFTSGPHGGWDSGSAWAALDFVTGERNLNCVRSSQWATAAAPGLVVVSEGGMVLEDLDQDGAVGTGWVLLYMHMAEEGRVAPGTLLETGDSIGHPSCEGGVSNASHLHFARRYNGIWIAADHPQWPMVLDGWKASSSGTAYDGTLSKGGLVKYAEEDWTVRNAIPH